MSQYLSCNVTGCRNFHADIHHLKWTDKVGGLPLEWNWLVGEYPYNANAKNIHFTEGGCYFEKYENCDYSKDWFNIYTNTVKIQL